ncbi:unnamed protein product [Agarophyton chilense]
MDSVELGLAKLAEIRECVDSIALDGAKFFDKGNKAAGVRARKALQDLKTLAQELRVAIQRCKSESAHARMMQQSAHYLEHQEPFELPPPLQSMDTVAANAAGTALSAPPSALAQHLPPGAL